MFRILLLCLSTIACASNLPKMTISQEVFKVMPFSSQFSEDGALIYNVDFNSVNSLIPKINEQFNVELEDRGESHITVLTPPEAQGWFNPDNIGVNRLVPTSEIQETYSSYIQAAEFEIICLGRRQNKKGNDVFYLVVDTPDLMKIREEIESKNYERAKAKGLTTYFDSNNWWPHITVGFVNGDVHGVTKGDETCVADIVIE